MKKKDRNKHLDSIEIFKKLTPKENKFFSGKKILLLGSDGFLGKSFLDYFILLDTKKIYFNLDCVDNNISSDKKNHFKNKKRKFYS